MNKSDSIHRKYENIHYFDGVEWEIETDRGWRDIKSVSKTIPYKVWIIKLENGNVLECADDHILFTRYGKEIFAKECIPGITDLKTSHGISTVLDITITSRVENMYDLEVDGNRYYSNNILSHNSTTILSFLLHYALFNSKVNVAILANKGQLARDQLERIQLAYEHLPKWLQQGVTAWNKGSIELENKSKIIASSTSSNAIRGGSYNIIFLDEFAHVEEHIASQFFNSVYPTISSGRNTKVLIVSTPNGLNLFYKMWTYAIENHSRYVPIEVHWTEVPGRDEEWKKETIANTSEDQFRQEFESLEFSTTINIDRGNNIKELISIGELYDELSNETIN